MIFPETISKVHFATFVFIPSSISPHGNIEAHIVLLGDALLDHASALTCLALCGNTQLYPTNKLTAIFPCRIKTILLDGVGRDATQDDELYWWNEGRKEKLREATRDRKDARILAKGGTITPREKEDGEDEEGETEEQDTSADKS